jgi:hypothetical protein
MSSTPPSESVVARSLVDAWHTDTPSPAELRRGYARFTRVQPTQSALVRLASGLALGLVLGVGMAQGASMVPWQRWLGPQEVTVQSTAKPAAPAPAVYGGNTPLAPQPDLPVAPLPPAAPAPVPRAQPATDSAPRLALPSSASAIPYVQQQWQQAAAALRANDFKRAQAALLEVERSVSGGERDAARLARAQLLSSHGHTAEALQLLGDLQAHAQSSVVRDQSRNLSARLEKTGEQQRSAEEPAETKQP